MPDTTFYDPTMTTHMKNPVPFIARTPPFFLVLLFCLLPVRFFSFSFFLFCLDFVSLSVVQFKFTALGTFLFCGTILYEYDVCVLGEGEGRGVDGFCMCVCTDRYLSFFSIYIKSLLWSSGRGWFYIYGQGMDDAARKGFGRGVRIEKR